MKKSLLILLSIVTVSVFGQYKIGTVKMSGIEKEGSVPKKVKVYIDSSKSMAGFFKGSNNTEDDKISIFKFITTFGEMNRETQISFYEFESKCSDTAIVNNTKDLVSFLQQNTFFDSSNNVYSDALESMDSKTDANTLSIMLTDGVPSTVSEGSDSQRINQTERASIDGAIRNYLDKDKDNTVLLLKFDALFNGTYYSSDGSFNSPKDFRGKRKIYALVFTNKKYTKFLRSYYKKEDLKGLNIEVLKYNVNDEIESFEIFENNIVDKGNKVVLTTVLKTSPDFDESLIKGVYDSKGNPLAYELNKEDRDNIITIEIDHEFIDNQPFELKFKNKSNIESFRKFNIEAEKENDVFSTATRKQDYFDKTFRFNYLLDPIDNNMKNRELSVISFSIEPVTSWVSYFEPLFGVIKPNAKQKFINDQWIPFYLFLFRWLTPILIALIIYFVFFNYKMVDVNMASMQKKIWYGGLALIILIELIASGLYMFIDYGIPIESMGYKIKHLVYNPILSIIIYVLVSLIFKRNRNCTAPNIPF